MHDSLDDGANDKLAKVTQISPNKNKKQQIKLDDQKQKQNSIKQSKTAGLSEINLAKDNQKSKIERTMSMDRIRKEPKSTKDNLKDWMANEIRGKGMNLEKIFKEFIDAQSKKSKKNAKQLQFEIDKAYDTINERMRDQISQIISDNLTSKNEIQKKIESNQQRFYTDFQQFSKKKIKEISSDLEETISYLKELFDGKIP